MLDSTGHNCYCEPTPSDSGHSSAPAVSRVCSNSTPKICSASRANNIAQEAHTEVPTAQSHRRRQASQVSALIAVLRAPELGPSLYASEMAYDSAE